MLERKRPLDDGFMEMFERERQGVHIEYASEIEEDLGQQLLGGLIRIEKHVSVSKLIDPLKPRRR